MSINATPYPSHSSSVQQKGDMAKIDKKETMFMLGCTSPKISHYLLPYI